MDPNDTSAAGSGLGHPDNLRHLGADRTVPIDSLGVAHTPTVHSGDHAPTFADHMRHAFSDRTPLRAFVPKVSAPPVPAVPYLVLDGGDTGSSEQSWEHVEQPILSLVS